VGIVGDFAGWRGELNREHPVTAFASEESDLLHLSDAGHATGFAEGTPGRWFQEKAEASLV
jgi:hypothetical protein